MVKHMILIHSASSAWFEFEGLLNTCGKEGWKVATVVYDPGGTYNSSTDPYIPEGVTVTTKAPNFVIFMTKEEHNG